MSRACPRDVADRAQMILLAYDKCNNTTIAERLGCHRRTVREVRNRWAAGFDRLVRVECLESDDAFRSALVDALLDDPASNRAMAARLMQQLVEADDSRVAVDAFEPAVAAAPA